MPSLTPLPLVRKIELALLLPQLARAEIETGCAAAIARDCVNVIVAPHYIEFARKALKGTHLKVASVVGFPHGGVSTATKMYEVQDVVQRGAEEIGMTLNIGALRDHDDLVVHNDIATVVRTARAHPITVILETPFLSDEEKTRACKIAEAAGATFVQTATGFFREAAISADVRVLRAACVKLQVKAAGGIDSQDIALELIEAGAARIIVSDIEKILGA